MNDLVLDLSVFQDTVDFAALKGKVVAVFAKATDGLTEVDPQFRRNRDVARNRGIPAGGYHFARMYDDGALQAKHFLSVMGANCNVIPMVDVEEESFAGVDAPLDVLISRLSHLIATIDQKLPIGKRALIYTNWDTWTRYMGNTDAFAGHPLWVAQSEDPRVSGLFGGWTRAAIWQSGQGTIEGIDTQVDLDQLLVPLAEILR